MVTDESPLSLLFRPEEIELLLDTLIEQKICVQVYEFLFVQLINYHLITTFYQIMFKSTSENILVANFKSLRKHIFHVIIRVVQQ